RESVFVPEVVTELALADGRAERSVAFPADDDALFAFGGRRGELYSITLVAEDSGDERSDPLLEGVKGSGTAGESLFQDDDGGGELNARVIAELPESGTYTIQVSNLSGGGSARLTVAKMTLRAAAAGSLAYGTAATVSFDADSAFVTDDGDR